MKKIIFLLVAFMPYLAFGQKAKIEFEKTSHNFGTISENGGKVTYNFVFKNTGNTPLILTNVRAGCGCTVPEWNRQPVAPGTSGSIKVSFNPQGRPGSFVKSVTVNSNSSTPVISLTLRGNVSRKPMGPYDAYKYTAGPLRLTTSNINFGAIKHTDVAEKNIELINTDTKPVQISFSTPVPNIRTTPTPTTLKKGEKGKITLTYDATAKEEWGFITAPVEINVDGQKVGQITVAVHINEDFSSYEGNHEKAPVAVFSEESVQLENLAKNSTQTHDFYIQNSGKSDLIIRKTKPSDSNTSIHLAKNIIKPGKKTKATITFETGNTPKTTKIIQFITNDPKNTVINYRLIAKTK